MVRISKSNLKDQNLLLFVRLSVLFFCVFIYLFLTPPETTPYKRSLSLTKGPGTMSRPVSPLSTVVQGAGDVLVLSTSESVSLISRRE